MDRRFHYKAMVRSVHDGDTVTVDIDLGFHTVLCTQSCRLLGIDAPEMSTPAGVKSRDQLRLWLPLDKPVFIVTDLDRDEKYGRTLVVLYLDGRFRPPSINKRLVEAGLAKVYAGGARGG